ncbi:MAG: M15 family metallopeptidase [Bacteroidales bacterium]|nr:M15 family metallopeptidase [Bacteroidales bacterium]
MQNLKFIQIILLFSLILLVFSCKKNDIELLLVKNSNIVFCKIITSSETQIYKLLDTNLWQSSFIGKDEVIVFSFFKPVWIDNVVIEQPFNTENKIISLNVYSNNGFLGQFDAKNIELKQMVSFLIFKIEQTADFKLTDAYFEDEKYSVAFDDLNKPVSIKQISFWKNDSTQIELNVIKTVVKNSSVPVFIPNRKNFDYSNNKKSLTLKKTGELIGFCEGATTDTFYFGLLDEFSDPKKTATFTSNFLIFNENSVEKKVLKSDYYLDGNILKSNTVSDFIFDFNDDYFVDIATFDTNIVHDIRYATDNNFTSQVIYECSFCLFRYRAARDLKKASEEFQTLGYRIKVFDCYRPHSAQYKLWEILPNKNYVANPDIGSIHNRGAAVDLTLVDSSGNELNMGTEFDFFGFAAYSINLSLPDSILQNRFLLWQTMNKHGFKEIKTEWWHMSHNSCLLYPVSDMNFPCKK